MSTVEIDEIIDNAFNTIMPGKDPTTGNNLPFPIPVNESAKVSLQLDTLKGRFYADMIKDMGVPYNGTTSLTSGQIIDIVNIAFGDDSPFKNPNITNANAYKSQTLQQRYNQIMRENANNIKQYRNILKTSVTAVSGYSNARYQFYESGLGVKRICANKAEGECINVDTAAAHLDTAGKDKSDATAHFNMRIDSDTFQSYGFPADTAIKTNWIDLGKCNIAINGLPNPQNPSEQSRPEDFIPLYPNRSPELLGPYTSGNAVKNQELFYMLYHYKYQQQQQQQPYKSILFPVPIPYESIPNVMKYILLVKEFGDVLQVMEYYGIVSYLEVRGGGSNPKEIIRPRFNMQTTDSVVFDLCVSLELPCTYTGSREGVTSGGITVIMYEYVETPPATILQNRLTSIYQGLNGRLNSLKFGINTGLTILSSLSYEIPEGYVAPGKNTRPSRSASRGNTPRGTPRPSRSSPQSTEPGGIPTSEPVRLEPADNFYAHTNIMHIIDPNNPANNENFRNMTLSESIQLKRNLLSLLLDAVETASNVLKGQFDTIINNVNNTTIIAGSLNADIQNGTTLLQNATTIMLGTQELGFDQDPIVKVKGTGWIIRNPILVEWFAYFSGYFPPDIPLPINFYDTGSFTYNNGETMVPAYTYPNFTPPTTTGGDGKKTWNRTSKRNSSSFLKRKPLHQKGGSDTEDLTLENCIYLKEAVDVIVNKGIGNDPRIISTLLALKFSEIQSQSRVDPLLYPKLLLKFGGYLEQKCDPNGNPLGITYDTDGNPVAITVPHIEINNFLIEEFNHFETTNTDGIKEYNMVAPIKDTSTGEVVNFLVTVNISEDKANEIMKEMNIVASNYLHIADVDHFQEIIELMDTYINQFNKLQGIQRERAIETLPANFTSKITSRFEGQIPGILNATYNVYNESKRALNFVGKEVYYNYEPYPVVSVNQNNTFTLMDRDNNILPVPITDIGIPYEQDIISVNDYINIQLNNFRYYYNYTYEPGTQLKGRVSDAFIYDPNSVTGVIRIEDDEDTNSLNILFSLWFENFTGTHIGGNKKAKKTKKKRKTKKHTKKIKYRKKKSKSKTIRKTEKKRK